MSLTVLSVGFPLARLSTRTAGGAEQVLAMLDEALVRGGHKSIVLAPTGSACSGLLIPAQVPVGVLDENAKRQARSVFKKLLDRTLRDYRIDVIHMHGLDFYEYLPDCDMPIVVSLHLPLIWYSPEAFRFVKPSVSFVCVSESQAKTAPAGVRVRVVPNGVDLHSFHVSRRKSGYAVAMSRVCPEKGLHLAIDAAEKADVDLTIAGSVFEYPEHRKYYDSMIAPRLNSRIRFIGPVGAARKAHLLAGARCLLVPSLAPETSSLVAMEALASGTPVIAFRSGALTEILANGRTGFLVNDAEQMAHTIPRAGAISWDECRRVAEQRFSSDRMAAQYFDLYRSLRRPEKIPELQVA
jgi:glycosyltransferase involved in cell wall biosynthesis